MGGKNLVLSGGEPLLAKHLYSIIELAHKLGLTTFISTNGILLTNDVVEKFLACKLDCMTVSVDGTGSAYESIRGQHNFEKLCSQLGSLSACYATRSMNIGFHVTVSRHNVRNISSVLSLAKEHHIRNVTFAYVSRLPEDVNQKTQSLLHSPFQDELNHWSLPDDIFIKEDQFQDLASEVEAIKEESKVLGIVCGIDPALDRNEDKRNLLTGRFPLKKRCFAPWETILVGPDGTLTACPMLTHSPLANIRESELSDYWQNNQMLNHIRNILIENRYLPVCYYCCGHGALL
jgi:MoaA/NifB/PqqE/SkfB family radical SAM enzyme